MLYSSYNFLNLNWMLIVLFHINGIYGAVKYVQTGLEMSYDKGFEECQSRSLVMARPVTKNDLINLGEVLQGTDGQEVVWLGMKYDGSQFLWNDGSRVTEVNWDIDGDDEPDHLDTQTCAAIQAVDLLWYSRKCDNLYFVVCQTLQAVVAGAISDQDTFIDPILAQPVLDIAVLPTADVVDPSLMTSESPLRGITTNFGVYLTDEVFIQVPTLLLTNKNALQCAFACTSEALCSYFATEKSNCSLFPADVSLTATPKQECRVWQKGRM